MLLHALCCMCRHGMGSGALVGAQLCAAIACLTLPPHNAILEHGS